MIYISLLSFRSDLQQAFKVLLTYCCPHTGPNHATIKNPDRSHEPRALKSLQEATDDLVNALLDDTMTMHQDGASAGKQSRAVRVAHAYPPMQPPPTYVPDMVERFNGHSSNSAVSRANLNAFAANRLQACPAPPASQRPSNSLQPKTTSRQRKGTVRKRRSSRETAMQQGPTFSRHTGAIQTKVAAVQHTETSKAVPENPPKLNRKSMSILALTDDMRLDHRGVMDIRRSKTTREPGKFAALKQKGVLKMMTTALTDRLHRANKATETEVKEADQGRGAGFYNYESNQFVKDVMANAPTQKRQVPSRLAEICERHMPPTNEAQLSHDGSGVRIFNRQSVRSSNSQGSTDDPFADPISDPFADPDCTKRATTEFVTRLKATTPRKTSRNPIPGTPPGYRFDMESVMRDSYSSMLPFPPVAASTPRVFLNRRRSSGADGPLRESSATARRASSVLALSPDVDVLDTQADATSGGVPDPAMPNTGRNLAPMHGYTYQPMLIVPSRKKHPSPNKIDLQLLETRLREQWPDTISGATETKKHPSPLKIDMQVLSEQFRKAYPDLVRGNTPKQRQKHSKLHRVVTFDEETDELALSFVPSTPEKLAVPRRRKASSVASFSQVMAADNKANRKTMAMHKCAGMAAPTPHMPLACPAYHQA